MRAPWFCLLLALFGGAANAAGPAKPAPWWSAFDDPVLVSLMQATPQRTPDAEQALVQDYIVARVGIVRMMLADGLARAAREEQALLMNAAADAPRDAALSAVGRRLEVIERTAATIEAERDKSLATLAARSGIEDAKLRGLLAPASGRRALPSVAAAPPQAAPASAAAGLAQQLADLGEEARRVDVTEQLVQTRRMELQAHQTRQRLGAENPIGTLQAYQQFVVDSDQLAMAAGRLALAWSVWLQGSGGLTVAAAATP